MFKNRNRWDSHLRCQELKVTTSVTRCWNKRLPKFLQSFPVGVHGRYYFKSATFHKSRKNFIIFWQLLKQEIMAKMFQKQPNLVTLLTTLPIVPLCGNSNLCSFTVSLVSLEIIFLTREHKNQIKIKAVVCAKEE